MPKQPSPQSAQLDLLSLGGAPNGDAFGDEERRSPRRQKGAPAGDVARVADTGLLLLPPIASFKSMAAMETAIGVLEPYLAELRRRCGNRLGAKRSAEVRASKRPPAEELDAFFSPRDGYGSGASGAAVQAAKHYGVNRRTIARWRRTDASR